MSNSLGMKSAMCLHHNNNQLFYLMFIIGREKVLDKSIFCLLSLRSILISQQNFVSISSYIFIKILYVILITNFIQIVNKISWLVKFIVIKGCKCGHYTSTWICGIISPLINPKWHHFVFSNFNIPPLPWRLLDRILGQTFMLAL